MVSIHSWLTPCIYHLYYVYRGFKICQYQTTSSGVSPCFCLNGLNSKPIFSFYSRECFFSFGIIVFLYIMLRGIDLRWKKLEFEPKAPLRFRHLSFTGVCLIACCSVSSLLVIPTAHRYMWCRWYRSDGHRDAQNERTLSYLVWFGFGFWKQGFFT